MLNGFGVVVNALGGRVKPYLPQICGTILWRLNNKAAKVRQQAADLISRIANVMHICGEVCFGKDRERMHGNLSTVKRTKTGYCVRKCRVNPCVLFGRCFPSVSPVAGNRALGGWLECVGAVFVLLQLFGSLIVNNDDVM